MPVGLDPLHLPDGLVEVVHLQCAEGEEAVRGLLAVGRDPVVVGGEGARDDVSVLDLVDVEEDAGVEHLGVDAVELLVLQPLGDVVAAGAGEVVAALPHRQGLGGGEVHVLLQESSDDKTELAVAKVQLGPSLRIGDGNVRRPFPKFGLQGLEELWRLHNVRI